MSLAPVRVWDPLYGRIEFGDLDAKILSSPEVQRLRYIRMCNINSMLIPGASEVSRFEHSIGSYCLGKTWVAAHDVIGDLALEIPAACLLHDVLTPAFGHSLQYVFEDDQEASGFKHDGLVEGEKARFYQVLDANASFSGHPFQAAKILGRHWEAVASLVSGTHELSCIVAGTLDLDNLDNVIRLAFHAGLTEERDRDLPIKLSRLLDSGKRSLRLSNRAIGLVQRWQLLRKILYTHLLEDWAEFSAKAMLTRILEGAVESGFIGIDSWRLCDLELLSQVERKSVGEHQDLSLLIKRLRVGRLYHPIALLSSSSTSDYPRISKRAWKEEFERELRGAIRPYCTNSCSYLVHPILDRGKTNRSVECELIETGEQIRIGSDSNRLLIGVFASSNPRRRRVQSKMTETVIERLEAHGIQGLIPLPDPMPPESPVEHQMLLRFK